MRLIKFFCEASSADFVAQLMTPFWSERPAGYVSTHIYWNVTPGATEHEMAQVFAAEMAVVIVVSNGTSENEVFQWLARVCAASRREFGSPAIVVLRRDIHVPIPQPLTLFPVVAFGTYIDAPLDPLARHIAEVMSNEEATLEERRRERETTTEAARIAEITRVAEAASMYVSETEKGLRQRERRLAITAYGCYIIAFFALFWGPRWPTEEWPFPLREMANGNR